MTPKKRKPIDLGTLTLDKGSHDSLAKGACVMEAVSYIAGETWSDSPECASPILAGYLRNLNDTMDTEARQALKPLIPLVIGTNTGPEGEQKRGLLAVDWIVREYTPAWLELAKLDTEAEALRDLPEIDSWLALIKVTGLLQQAQQRSAAARAAAGAAAWAAAEAAARDAAWDAARDAAGAAAWAAAGAAAGDAAWAAARDAAWDAAEAAARDAAWAAAWDAAEAAAWAAAWDAAWDAAEAAAGAAARDAAWAAAWAKLAPTVARLQASAVELAKRMALVGKL